MPRDEIYPYRQKPANNTRTQHTNPPRMLTPVRAAPESFDTYLKRTHTLEITRDERARFVRERVCHQWMTYENPNALEE